MCLGLEPVTIAAIASAAGGGLQFLNSQEALKRQDREQAAGIKARSMLQQEAGNRVRQQIDDVAKSTSDQERRAANDAFVMALRNAKAADGGADFDSMGATSDRFAADVGQARQGARAEGATLASNLAAIDAPQYQRQREARGFADTATDLGMIGDRAQSLDFLTQLRTANAGRTNPWVDALGGGLQAFGSTYAGRAKKPGIPKTMPTNKELFPGML